MSNVFTLDSLREETRNKFAPVKIGLSDGTEVELQSLLKLTKASREVVLKTVEDLQLLREGEGEDDLSPEERELLIESLATIFTTVAKADADKLISELHDDDQDVQISMMTSVLSEWMKRAQVGEARNSLS